MIDYTLAKELKDAGFPQDKCSGIWKSSAVGPSTQPLLGVPTLSELIDVCGGGFETLIKYTDVNGVVTWGAGTFEDSERGAYLLEGNTRYKTPSEAVAHLWLVLNKKEEYYHELDDITYATPLPHEPSITDK